MRGDGPGVGWLLGVHAVEHAEYERRLRPLENPGGMRPHSLSPAVHGLTGHPAQAPAEGSFPTDFKDYPGGVEYFDVYHGPITSVYSQVWWTSTKNEIPADIVERFKGKVMAVVGMESDQVRKGAGPNGEDVSVPISMAYNHQ